MPTEPGDFQWDFSEPEEWARAFGLVYIPMFPGPTALNAEHGNHHVLLDGQKSSFALFSGPDMKESASLPSYTWSSNLGFAFAVDSVRRRLTLHRWDFPGSSHNVAIPSTVSQMNDMLHAITSTQSIRYANVIDWAIARFRSLWGILGTQVDRGHEVLRIFNLLLLGTEAARKNSTLEPRWLRCATVKEVRSYLRDTLRPESLEYSGFDETDRLDSLCIEGLPAALLDPHPLTGLVLHPDLLLRHAAGPLYQEAHLEIELKALRQRSLPGIPSPVAPAESAARDVRFTPPSLARLLVQRAMLAVGRGSPRTMEILDPACGSGVFLLEALREMIRTGFSGTVILRGFDTSPVACYVSRYTLSRSVREFGSDRLDIRWEITETDALASDWGKPDIVAMNPPFAAWSAMSGAERDRVREVLGSLYYERADKAMAFLWKAASSLLPSAVLATVLPSPFLDSRGGLRLREALVAQGRLSLVGRFTGFGYFRGAVVEPAFVVWQRSGANTVNAAVQLVIARDGAEDDAIRSLRKDPTGNESRDSTWEVFQVPASDLRAASWRPKRRSTLALSERLEELRTPRVRDLFDLQLGARLGAKPVFMLRERQYLALPTRERRYFRPGAGAGTIRDGRLEHSSFVFYPYDSQGPIFQTEEDLRSAVPTYFERHLRAAKPQLADRARVLNGKWWHLSEHRAWQRVQRPKLVSTYFVQRGSFAYDAQGVFVVVQGFAWTWRNRENLSEDEFHDSSLPWAYVALLNSPVFEEVLSHFCPRVRGGQLDVSERFAGDALVPDLSDDTVIVADTIEDLALIGREMARGSEIDLAQLELAAYRAYRMDFPGELEH